MHQEYRVLDHIGRGGMADVYLVEHTRLGTRHALKVLPEPNMDLRRRLLAEGRAQGTLRHENILAVTDVLDLDNGPGLVMDYVPGPTLAELIEEHDLTFDQVDVLARAILAGLAHAHAHGFVHRDLKPQNVLCATTGDGLVPKLADFGLVKSAGAITSHTRSGQPLGTALYMAPEQIRDASRVDRRADLWAAGVVLYEMLCGDVPFKGIDLLQVFGAITDGEYTWPVEVLAAAPPRMVVAVDAALQVEVADRVQTAETLADLWEGSEPGDSRAPAVRWPPEIVRRSPAEPAYVRRRRALRRLTALGIAVAAALGWMVWRALDAPPAAEPPEVPSSEAPAPSPEAIAEAPAEDDEPGTTWGVRGDMRTVFLRDATGEFHRPGTIAPGTYTVVLMLEGREPVEGNKIRLAAGESRQLTCSQEERACR